MKRFLVIMAGWLALLTIHAENNLSFSSVRGAPNEEVTVNVALQNSDAVAALQLSIPLDDALTLVEGSAVLSNRATNHQATVGVKDGVLNVMVYSLNMKALDGTNGEVVSFQLKLGREPKDIELTPTKVVLTQSNGSTVAASCQSGNVSIRTPKAQYSAMEVDFGHVPIRDTYTQSVSVTNVGNEPLTITALNFSDVNVFSSTTALPLTVVAGETKALNVIYKPTERGSVERTMQVVCNSISKLNTITLKADPFAVNELHVQDANGVSDEETTIHLTMNNMDAINGFQFEFALPDELKYVDGSFVLSDRKADHTVLATLNGGVIRAICYSPTNAAFADNDGEIASFRVKLNGRYGLTLEPQKAVLTAQIKGITTDVLSAKYGGYVNIQSPQLPVQNDLDMGHVPVTEDCTCELSLSNYGDVPLTISRVQFDNDALNVKEVLPLTIEAGSSKVLTVEYTCLDEKNFAATMQIYSNDPDQRLVNISVTGNRFAPNYLAFDAQNTTTTSDLCLNVNLDNYDAINGIQFDVKLPTMTADKKTAVLYQPKTDGITLTERATGMTVEVRQIDTATFRYFCYFLNNNGIKKGNGNVMMLTFEPSGALTEDRYQLQIDNIKFGTSNLVDKYSGESSVTCTFMVKSSYKGDVNNDGEISLADMVTLASDMLNNVAYNPAHDLNNDQKIDDVDLQQLANIILHNIKSPQSGLDIGIGDWGDGGEFGGSVGARRSVATSSSHLSVSAIKFDANSNRYYFNIDLTEQNSTLFCGAIINIKLPQNLSFSLDNVQTPIVECVGEDCITDNHKIYGNPTLQQDGSLRFIVFNNQLADFKQTSGTIARVYVASEETSGMITILPGELATSGDKGIASTVNHTEEVSFDLEEISGIMGDVNGDRKITTLDVVATINHILGSNPGNFKKQYADLNKDGKITTIDVVTLINLILNK